MLDWKEVANYGVTPIVLLLVMVTGLYRITSWMRKSVVEPVLKSHLELIEVLKKAIPEQTAKLDKILEANQQLVKVVNEEKEQAGKETETAVKLAAAQHRQLAKLQTTLDSQTAVLKTAIDYQTQVIEDRPKSPEPRPKGATS